LEESRSHAFTLVIAAVNVVLPWSTWPMVPILQCSLSIAVENLDNNKLLVFRRVQCFKYSSWHVCVRMQRDCKCNNLFRSLTFRMVAAILFTCDLHFVNPTIYQMKLSPFDRRWFHIHTLNFYHNNILFSLISIVYFG